MVSGWAGGLACSGKKYHLFETIRYGRLILCDNIFYLGCVCVCVGGGGCTTLWYNLDFTFDFTMVNPTLKEMSGLYWEAVMCQKLICSRVIGWGCRCAMS